MSSADLEELRRFATDLQALSPELVPVDESTTEQRHFDLFSLIQDFVVATAAELTAGGLQALILSRWRASQAESPETSSNRAAELDSAELEDEQDAAELKDEQHSTTPQSEEAALTRERQLDVKVSLPSDGVVEIRITLK